MPYLMQELLETAIVDARHAVAFTGAGISTESGIPDFRSPGSGLWQKYDQSLMDIDSFRDDPVPFYAMAAEIAGPIFSARPNPAHAALARLESAGKLDGVITQNIDGLHQQAGSKNVIELHGSLRTCTCTRCGSSFPVDVLARKLVNEGELPPVCDECNMGILKPDATFFGEPLPSHALARATATAEGCDLFIVLGSSLEVYPANRLPRVALDHGAQLAIVNREPTMLDPSASILLRATLGDVLPDVADRVLYRVNQSRAGQGTGARKH
ncbi:MAG: Sir2 family NAD-dependent protein deacetylase [Candidatus Lokiarchaeota archaeon]|nr:Sir2 family NAD-dependent protein deacetylase [Candidatus Lokiarchaeota archaeon]